MRVNICGFAEAGAKLCSSLFCARQKRHSERGHTTFYLSDDNVRWAAKRANNIWVLHMVYVMLMEVVCMQRGHVFRCEDLYTVDCLVWVGHCNQSGGMFLGVDLNMWIYGVLKQPLISHVEHVVHDKTYGDIDHDCDQAVVLITLSNPCGNNNDTC